MSAGSISWIDTWSDTTRMPAAVRLEVFGRDGRKLTAPLVVDLRIDSSVSCDSSGEGDNACPDDESQAAEPVAPGAGGPDVGAQ
jgi:hypothetical protein